MYFPILRGKVHELKAVRALSSIIKEDENVIPVIEPMNCNTTTQKTLFKLNEEGVPFVLIVNPSVGNIKGCVDEIAEKLVVLLTNKETSRLGYIISGPTTIQDISTMLENYPDYKIMLIHQYNVGFKDDLVSITRLKPQIEYHMFHKSCVSDAYRKTFCEFRRIIIEDCFNARKRNADYPPKEYFSDLVYLFAEDYYGFGDYQAIGSEVIDGGPAHAVALHYICAEGEKLWIRHFVSDDVTGTYNVQGKYFQALEKLCDFIDGNQNEPFTLGEYGYKDNLKSGIYHGLGHPKRLSIMHYVHLVSNIIKKNKVEQYT